jgi:hypothetical protein
MGQMSTKSRENIYGSTIRHSAERAKEARKEADLTCDAWNYRMLGYNGPAPALPYGPDRHCEKGRHDQHGRASGEHRNGDCLQPQEQIRA